jgi:hypothetical protein
MGGRPPPGLETLGKEREKEADIDSESSPKMASVMETGSTGTVTGEATRWFPPMTAPDAKTATAMGETTLPSMEDSDDEQLIADGPETANEMGWFRRMTTLGAGTTSGEATRWFPPMTAPMPEIGTTAATVQCAPLDDSTETELLEQMEFPKSQIEHVAEILGDRNACFEELLQVILALDDGAALDPDEAPEREGICEGEAAFSGKEDDINFIMQLRDAGRWKMKKYSFHHAEKVFVSAPPWRRDNYG